jgi:hypothetical protein
MSRIDDEQVTFARMDLVYPLGKGSGEMVLLLASLIITPSLGFARATLGLEMGTSRRYPQVRSRLFESIPTISIMDRFGRICVGGQAFPVIWCANEQREKDFLIGIVISFLVNRGGIGY